MYLILMQWQVQTHVCQKNKRFKFEKDLAAMIKLLKEEKADARQEMKYVETLVETEEEKNEAKAYLKSVSQRLRSALQADFV